MGLPVDMAAARRQLRLEEDDTSRDADLQGYIADAAGWVERYTGHLLTEREVTEEFTSWDRLQLRAWPIAADAVLVVTYSDATQAIPVTGVRMLARRPARLVPLIGSRWPRLPYGSVISVTVTAGYASPDAVEPNLRRAMLGLIGAYDVDREHLDAVPAAIASAKSLCRDLRPRAL